MNVLRRLAWFGIPSIALVAILLTLWPHDAAPRAEVLPIAPASSTSDPTPRPDPEYGDLDPEYGDGIEGARSRMHRAIEAQDPAGAGCLEAGTCIQITGSKRFGRDGAGLFVWWHGEVPESAREIASADPSIEVRFEAAPYNQQQIIAGVHRLIGAIRQQCVPGAERAKVYSFTESHRGEGITVAVHKSLLSRKAELERSMSAEAGVPVTLKRGSPIVPAVIRD